MIDDGSADPIVLARGELLARTRRRSARRQRRRCAPSYRGRRALPDRLLRPARARQARPRPRSSCARPRPRWPQPTRRAGGRARARRRHALRRSASATSCCYFARDLGEQSTDVAVLEALGELTGRRNDARAMLELGKSALGRGLALDHYAFPTIGIPQHTPGRARRSSAASSIRWRAPRARSTSATSRRPMRSA